MKILRVLTVSDPGGSGDDFALRSLPGGGVRAPRVWGDADIAAFMAANNVQADDGDLVDLGAILNIQLDQVVASVTAGGLSGQELSVFTAEMRALLMRGKMFFAQHGGDAEPARLVPVEDPDSVALMTAQKRADISRAAQEIGQRVFRRASAHIIDACDRSSVFGFDPQRNLKLGQRVADALDAGLDSADVERILSYARQGYEDVPFLKDAAPPEAPAPEKILLSIPDSFFETAITGHGFFTPHGHIHAPERLEQIAETIWASGAPSLSFRDRGALRPSLPGQARRCVIDLSSFVQGAGADAFDAAGLAQAVRLAAVSLDALGEEAELSLGLTGYARALMRMGLAYDSDVGRAFAAVMTAYVAALFEDASAQLAQRHGATLLSVPAGDADLAAQQNNRRSRLTDMYARRPSSAAPLSRAVDVPLSLCKTVSPGLWQAAIAACDDAVASGRAGLRHRLFLHVDRGPPHGFSPLPQAVDLMGLDAGDDAGHSRRLNGAVVAGLRRLGYTARQIDDIHAYVAGHGTLVGASGIDHEKLLACGLTAQHLARIESALTGVQHLRQAFTAWTTGHDVAGDILAHLGFSADDIEAANLHACGAMTLEGAPHLRPEHVAVFDGALQGGQYSVRSVSPLARLRLQAAVETFLRAPAVMTLTLPPLATIDDVQQLILKAWEMGLKQLDIYRDGCASWRPLMLEASGVSSPRSASAVREGRQKALAS
jgi:ribonucleoside-diphosphate reductase alpha chain